MKCHFFLFFILLSHISFAYSPSDTAKARKQGFAFELLREARTLAEDERYEASVRAYKKILQIDSTRYSYNFELGMVLFYYLENKKDALKFLERAFSVSPRDTSYDLIKCLAQCQQFRANYPEAMRLYNLYNKKEAKSRKYDNWNREVTMGQQVCNFALAHNTLNDSVIVENLGKLLNSNYPEYAPVVNKRDSMLLFCSRKPENNFGRKDATDNKFFEDIFVSYKKGDVWQKPTRYDAFHGILDSLEEDVHKSVVGLSYDEKTLFLYRKNLLWQAARKGDSWDVPVVEGGYINLSQYQTHKSLSADGNTMFIVAEGFDTRGGRDIYVVKKKSDGSWDFPVNMGDFVNTPYDENSPQVSGDGKTLYFSSKGLPGYGGYDIFKTTLVDGQWTQPVNMGLPVNSPGDDLYYQYNESSEKAYFASNRLGGFGDMDIYQVSPQKERLIEFIARPFQKQLNASDYAKEKSGDFTYQWQFGDGETGDGKYVAHTWQSPGPFEGILTVKDSLQKNEIASYPVHIAFSLPAFIEITGQDTIAEGQQFAFSSGNSFIENMRIRKLQWSFGDGSVAADSASVHHTYSAPGSYALQLICRGINEKSRNKISYFTNKTLVVLPPEQYSEWMRKKTNAHPVKTATTSVNAQAKTSRQGTTRKIFIDESFDETAFTLDTLQLPKVKLDAVYFNPDQSELRQDAMHVLDENISQLKRFPDLVVQVKGMADIRGSEEYNIRLSNRRAITAIRYLNEHGIPASRITGIISLGESEATVKGKEVLVSGMDIFQRDRRVEFKIIGRAKSPQNK